MKYKYVILAKKNCKLSFDNIIVKYISLNFEFINEKGCFYPIWACIIIYLDCIWMWKYCYFIPSTFPCHFYWKFSSFKLFSLALLWLARFSAFGCSLLFPALTNWVREPWIKWMTTWIFQRDIQSWPTLPSGRRVRCWKILSWQRTEARVERGRSEDTASRSEASVRTGAGAPESQVKFTT